MTKINGVSIEEVDTVGEIRSSRRNEHDTWSLFRAACDAALIRSGADRNESGFRYRNNAEMAEHRSSKRRRGRR